MLKFEFALLYFHAIGGSRLVKNKRLDIDALVEGAISLDDHIQEGFVSASHHKDSLHPSVFFACDLLDYCSLMQFVLQLIRMVKHLG